MIAVRRASGTMGGGRKPGANAKTASAARMPQSAPLAPTDTGASMRKVLASAPAIAQAA